ncbi:ABC transporter substrate-binding protein [Oleomonas cavernae]|uniref:ABC transporter substrate-binding protein n=1 Tax=Oleomonas cavernae TaxID=2320859 RepID=A0A418W8H3_9PROT|nr:ABC transporter substrate-binding protein [Oleomonas cavernae]RJF86311.1 ABC transporter substrate-binding protein [Oleomonas cavernae]
MNRFLSPSFFGGVLAAMLFAAQGARAEDTIKVGVILPISGGAAYVGQGIGDGVRLAVKEINEAGGIDGRKLEILLRDEQMRPDAAVAAARELITREGVKLFIGPATSATGLAVSELAREEKVVNISPSAKTEAITGAKLHHYIFQLAPTTDIDGVRAIDVLKGMGTKSICFTGYDYAYTKDWFAGIKANMGGIENAGEFLVPINATDYSAVITQLIANSCDTVVGTMYGGGFIAFVKQAAPFGLFESKKLLWGANTGDYAVAAALGKDFPEGLWASSADVWYYEGSPAHTKYQAGLAALQGRKETDMWPITGYNAVYFLAAAIKKAGSADPEAVAKALEGLTIDSPLGPLTIDPTTHRASSPEFYGQVTTIEGTDVKRLTSLTVVR